MAKPNLIRRIFLAEDNVADVVLVREALEQQSLNCELTAYPNAQLRSWQRNAAGQMVIRCRISCWLISTFRADTVAMFWKRLRGIRH